MAKFFPTSQKESWKTYWFRHLVNWSPSYGGSGGRIIFISSDWREIQVRLSLSLRTRNYVGTVFGGSLYAACDPFFMLQLLHILGKDYVVWDKAATIRFRRPVKTKIYMRFLIEDALLAEIRQQVAEQGEYERSLPVEWKDKEGKVYAEVDKLIYVASKDFYREKMKNR